MQQSISRIENHVIGAEADGAQERSRYFLVRTAQYPVASADNSAGKLRSNRSIWTDDCI
jgi:hypothetical protein